MKLKENKKEDIRNVIEIAKQLLLFTRDKTINEEI